MITADQLKDVMDRADALHHYLNIDQIKSSLLFLYAPSV